MDLSRQVSRAIKHFWKVRLEQQDRQGIHLTPKDRGNRAAVTGRKHLDGFIELLNKILFESGLPKTTIHSDATTLPGYYRPTKGWDLVVVSEDCLLAAIELKSHIGPPFGNNFNNRTEEALGSSADLLTAYREGKFRPSPKPWMGWFMLLEDCPGSSSPVRVDEPYFDVFPEFKQSSYLKRYEILCHRLLRERLYDGVCLLLTRREAGLKGHFTEPDAELSFNRFAASLIAHVTACARLGIIQT